jgi:hypothetical protein
MPISGKPEIGWTTARVVPHPPLLRHLGRSSFEGRASARPPQDDGTWISAKRKPAFLLAIIAIMSPR